MLPHARFGLCMRVWPHRATHCNAYRRIVAPKVAGSSPVDHPPICRENVESVSSIRVRLLQLYCNPRGRVLPRTCVLSVPLPLTERSVRRLRRVLALLPHRGQNACGRLGSEHGRARVPDEWTGLVELPLYSVSTLRVCSGPMWTPRGMPERTAYPDHASEALGRVLGPYLVLAYCVPRECGRRGDGGRN
jgi:hypothetical protein